MYILFIVHTPSCGVLILCAIVFCGFMHIHTNYAACGLKTQSFTSVFMPQLQRRFAASPVYTCFTGVPFVGRGVEGCEAPALVNEEVRVMFSL